MPARRPMALQLALQIALLAPVGGPALADVITVGPGGTVERIADAARIARDGDTVLIKPGTYRGDVAVWPQQDLEIRGVGARPVLLADGPLAEGKGIWVLRSGRFRISNIEFRGARAPAGNGAGIRFERGTLELADCVFEDNENGILTGNEADSALRIANSVFGHAPKGGPLLPHLLYVGRIAPEKNLALLEKAFAAIHARHPRARLVMVGGGPALAALRSRQPRAVFAGMQTGTALAEHYASGDLFLFPSLTETYGNVVAEALASGLPVVAYRDAAALELIRHDTHGWLAEPGDEAAFVAGAVSLADAPAQRSRQALAARARVATLGWPAVVERLVALQRQIILSSPAALPTGNKR